LGLENGTYRITIRADGFGEIEKNLQATKGEIKNMDIVLTSGAPGTPSSPSLPKIKAPAKSGK